MRVGANMRIQQPGFAVFDNSVRIFKIGLAFADGLDLCAPQRDAGFKLVEEKVMMPGGTIYGSVPLPGRHRFTRFLLSGWMGRLILWPGHTFDYESSC